MTIAEKKLKCLEFNVRLRRPGTISIGGLFHLTLSLQLNESRINISRQTRTLRAANLTRYTQYN